MTTPKDPVVAIDGPAGSGKSTVARSVADALGLPSLDTGAMYRALTWAVLDAGIDPGDAPAVIGLAQRLDLDVGPPVRVGGRDVTDAIRTAEVSAAVSVVAAVPEVRVLLVAAQREWIEVHGGGVVEGRDIGTVVAPDAVLKIYLVASEEERARRRHRQDDATEAEGGDPPPGEVAGGSPSEEAAGGVDATLAAIRRRDAIDSGRAASPLAAADDAVVLDTTGLSVDGVVAEVLARYRAALEGADRP
jgi:cytidylate kinase